MRVVEIFSSIEGEGKRAGRLCTFIRLAGCNLRCSYCDTAYALKFTDGEEMSPEEILDDVCRRSKSNLVTLTGGEPLARDIREVRELLRQLTENGFEVNVETNGSIDVNRFRMPGVFFTVDYKCLSSGMSMQMQPDFELMLTSEDVVKYVVGSHQDLVGALGHYKLHVKSTGVAVYVSPVFGEIQPKEIVQFMQEFTLSTWHIQLQIHKFIWDPNMRGV